MYLLSDSHGKIYGGYVVYTQQTLKNFYCLQIYNAEGNVYSTMTVNLHSNSRKLNRVFAAHVEEVKKVGYSDVDWCWNNSRCPSIFKFYIEVV